MINAVSRITPTELSRERIDNQIVQAKYKAGYGFFVVKSKFTGNAMLGDLFFEIIRKKLEKCCDEQHEQFVPLR